MEPEIKEERSKAIDERIKALFQQYNLEDTGILYETNALKLLDAILTKNDQERNDAINKLLTSLISIKKLIVCLGAELYLGFNDDKKVGRPPHWMDYNGLYIYLRVKKIKYNNPNCTTVNALKEIFQKKYKRSMYTRYYEILENYKGISIFEKLEKEYTRKFPEQNMNKYYDELLSAFDPSEYPKLK